MNIENIIKQIEKDIDFSGVLTTLDATEKVGVISTGIPSLDNATQIGGIPRGLVSEVYGNTGSSKSSVCLSIVAQAQKLGLLSAYIDMELSMTKELATKMGVDMNNLIYAQPLSGEKAMELTEKLIEKGVKLIIIDSVSAMVTESEQERDFTQDSIGLQARMMSKFMRKILGPVKSNNVSLVFVNQIRDDINKMGFGPKTTTSGGRALRFYSSLRLECSRIGWIKKGEEKIGMNIRFLTAKNKLSRPQLQTDVQFLFDSGFDIDNDRLNVMVANNEVQLVGRTFWIGDKKIGNKEEIIKYINEKQTKKE